MPGAVLCIQQIKVSGDASIVGKDLDCRVSLAGLGSTGSTKSIRSDASLYTWGRLNKAPLLELHASSLQRLRGAELIVELRNSASDGINWPIAFFRWPLQSLQSKPALELITLDGHGRDPRGNAMPGLAPPRCTVKCSWSKAAPEPEIPLEVLEELEERDCDASSWFMRQHKFWSKDMRLVAAKVDFEAEKAALAKSRKASAPVASSRRAGAPRPHSASRASSKGRLPTRSGYATQQPPSPTGSCRSLGALSVASSRDSRNSAGASSMSASLEQEKKPSQLRPSSASRRPPQAPRAPAPPVEFFVTANTPLTSDTVNAIGRDGRVLRDTTRGSRARRIKEEEAQAQTQLVHGLSNLAGMLRQMATDVSDAIENPADFREDCGSPVAVM
eukprot:gnl/MRDRNA2_/MRDRNA2_111594_c0_seq1.p1 gnl/MRDRNA2_/MRDRNA2_111594_c0~~gnl/MRDRNA2_/MRDRNA2_111594_c0_seq1.p1  ORF type:complete len:388 (-),score=74.10 gnl/MRDRNA2_/MRDRNA2_111594_c0_seq1:39-1202(-)